MCGLQFLSKEETCRCEQQIPGIMKLRDDDER